MTLDTTAAVSTAPRDLAGARWHLAVALGLLAFVGALLLAFEARATGAAWALLPPAGAALVGWIAHRGGARPSAALLVVWALAASVAVAFTGGLTGPFAVLLLAPVVASLAIGGTPVLGAVLTVIAALLAWWAPHALNSPLVRAVPTGDIHLWTSLGAIAGLALAVATARARPALQAVEVAVQPAALPDPNRGFLFHAAELERSRDEALAAREQAEAAQRTAEAELTVAEEGRRAARAVLQVTVDGREAAEQRVREAEYARNMAQADRDHTHAQLAEVAAALDAAEALRREAETGRARAEDAAAARVRFLANMSHELRTPLNAIMGFSDIMQQRLFGPLSDKYGEYAGLIHTSGRHLLDLINDVLDMAKVESGRFELHRERFDGREPIEASMTLMRRQAEEGGVSLRAVLPSGEVEVDADRRAIKQMVLNLLSNALKFTPPGGEVTVIAGPRDQSFEITVADTGTGIAAEDVERLGRPFEQAGDSDARAQGTGLGLSLVKAMAGLHGGTMGIESALGHGTAVTVSLPVLANAPTLSAAADDNVVTLAPPKPEPPFPASG